MLNALWSQSQHSLCTAISMSWTLAPQLLSTCPCLDISATTTVSAPVLWSRHCGHSVPPALDLGSIHAHTLNAGATATGNISTPLSQDLQWFYMALSFMAALSAPPPHTCVSPLAQVPQILLLPYVYLHVRLKAIWPLFSPMGEKENKKTPQAFTTEDTH